MQIPKRCFVSTCLPVLLSLNSKTAMKSFKKAKSTIMKKWHLEAKFSSSFCNHNKIKIYYYIIFFLNWAYNVLFSSLKWLNGNPDISKILNCIKTVWNTHTQMIINFDDNKICQHSVSHTRCSNQFKLLSAPLPQKTILNLKVVKTDSKIIISLC